MHHSWSPSLLLGRNSGNDTESKKRTHKCSHYLPTPFSPPPSVCLSLPLPPSPSIRSPYNPQLHFPSQHPLPSPSPLHSPAPHRLHTSGSHSLTAKKHGQCLVLQDPLLHLQPGKRFGQSGPQKQNFSQKFREPMQRHDWSQGFPGW